eukprot:gene31613-8676_t
MGRGDEGCRSGAPTRGAPTSGPTGTQLTADSQQAQRRQELAEAEGRTYHRRAPRRPAASDVVHIAGLNAGAVAPAVPAFTPARVRAAVSAVMRTTPGLRKMRVLRRHVADRMWGAGPAGQRG